MARGKSGTSWGWLVAVIGGLALLRACLAPNTANRSQPAPQGSTYSYQPLTAPSSSYSTAPTLPARTADSRRLVAENGSYYGQISAATGQPKTVHVNGYYRKDGTYVRGHYRSKGR